MDSINRLDFRKTELRFDLQDEQAIPGASMMGINEEFPLQGARSLYGATKLCSELMIEEYLHAYKLRGVINRCGVISGPWQMGKVDQGFVVHWLARHKWPGKLSYFGYGGKGGQVRDIMHVEDLYSLLQLQLQNIGKISGNVYNVGGGLENSLSLAQLTRFCTEITGNRVEIGSEPETREADIPYYVSDCRKVNAATGWTPESNIQKILMDIFSWLTENESLLRPLLADYKNAQPKNSVDK